MRISEIEKTTIVNAILEKDRNAKIFLFGSRTDDFKKGGDIDILVQSDEIGLLEIVKIKSTIFKNIPEQKIDLLVSIPLLLLPKVGLPITNLVEKKASPFTINL